MKQARVWIVLIIGLLAMTTLAQQPGAPAPGTAPAAGAAGQRGGRGAQTPEQQAAAFALRQAQMAAEVRPIDAIDSVWIERLTVLEVRDFIKAGKTTGIIATGGVESNGPHLASGKHNFVLQQTAEAVARKLGNALVAPIVTLEPYRTDQPVGIGNWVGLSQATYKSVLYDMGDSMRAMGFKNIIYIGDSGGNQTGMKQAADELEAKYKGSPSHFYMIPEYYDYKSCQIYLQSVLKVPEKIEFGASNGSDGIHEEYCIDSLMALTDPETIRYEQRVKAGRGSINGASLLPLSSLLENGKLTRDLRAKLTVDAINKVLGAQKASNQQ